MSYTLDYQIEDLEIAANYFLHFGYDTGVVMADFTMLQKFVESSCKRMGIEFLNANPEAGFLSVRTKRNHCKLFYYTLDNGYPYVSKNRRT